MRKNYLVALAFLTALSATTPAMTMTVHADETLVQAEVENSEKAVIVLAASSDVYTEGNFKYTVSDGVATITGLVNPDISKTINLVIPAKVGNYVVKNIAAGAFEGNNNIKSVTFSKGLETIGSYAFKNCINLAGKISIPATVKAIYGNDYYTSDEERNYGAFYGTAISEVVIESGNVDMTIGISAFEKCVNLAKVTLPNRVSSVGDHAFAYDSGLVSVSILGGNRDVSIEASAFYSCANLSDISLGSGITSIGKNAFYNTASEKIVFPSTVKLIGEQAFAECKFLTEITLNEGLETIARAAFKNCSLLEGTITIPSTVTQIQGGDLHWDDSWGWRYTSELENKGGAFYGTGIEELVVKDSNTTMSIGASAFENCKSLTKITLPNRVTDIAEGAFMGDYSLTNVNICGGSNEVTIGKNAFADCEALTEVSLGEGVKTIKFGAFQVSGVKNITLPTTVTTIGPGVFYNCTDLESIILNEGLETIDYAAFAGCVSLTGELVIPSTVTDINGHSNKNEGAFYQTNFSSIVIKEGNAGINIGDYVFYNCNSLRSASLSNRVSSIGYGAFADTPIVWVKISNGNHTMTIDKYAFSGCYDLKAVSIPKNITSVGTSAFGSCTSLSDVYYAGTQKQYNALCTSVGGNNDSYTDATWHYESMGPDVWPSTAFTGWKTIDGKDYWYEDNVLQGTEGRGKEIYDPGSNAWYWLDAVQGGAKAVSKDVYQESVAGEWGGYEVDGVKMGKWVRYDENGHMIKGWQITEAGTYYFDEVYGTMAKGSASIDGKMYYFDINTGIMQSSVDDDNRSLYEDGWHKVNGVNYWYEGGVRQGYNPDDASYRGKEIYDPGSDAWYWLDNVQLGAVAKNKDVYQESNAGDWGAYEVDGVKIGKWVRYDAYGHMIKGWSELDGNKYYFDPVYGTMARGDVVIDGVSYRFDVNTGILQ